MGVRKESREGREGGREEVSEGRRKRGRDGELGREREKGEGEGEENR